MDAEAHIEEAFIAGKQMVLLGLALEALLTSEAIDSVYEDSVS